MNRTQGNRRFATLLLLSLTLIPRAHASAAELLKPAVAEVPVIGGADVVVVGGSSGAVAAAAAAAEKGARVFLVTDRPYLGDDLCATLRLWADASTPFTTALGRALFSEVPGNRSSLPFTYTASRPADPKHPDPDGRALTDGRWQTPVRESVQYNGDVVLTVDLGSKQDVRQVRLHAFTRPDDFSIAKVEVLTSDDARTWTEPVAGTPGAPQASEACEVLIPVDRAARYLRVAVRPEASASRVLLGELVIESSAPASGVRQAPSPMHVKRTLGDALRAAKVEFLLGAYPVDVLRDPTGRIGGVVIISRSGRQAIPARMIIDATPRATVARLAGAGFEPYPAGEHRFARIVAGTEIPADAPGVRRLPGGIPGESLDKKNVVFPTVEHQLTMPMKDGSFRAFAEAEQLARDRTWRKGQALAAETLFQVPPDTLHARTRQEGAWPGADRLDLAVLQPANMEGVLVLGGCAAVSRAAAELFLHPANLMRVGERAGAWTAEQARAKAAAATETLSGTAVPAAAAREADLRDVRPSLRPVPAEVTVKAARPVPVVGRYDVVVVGGGTAGAPAGIAAARQGAKTLLVEYQFNLGGVSTLALIGRYWYGNPVGFTAEIDRAVPNVNPGSGGRNRGWDIEERMEWYRRELRKAGAEIWFGTLATGVWMDRTTVKGVLIATADGLVAVEAGAVVDATGAADLAAAAGAPTRFIEADAFAIQGVGLSPRTPGVSYTNTDWDIVDDADVRDTTRMRVTGWTKFSNAFDLAAVIGSRERRSIVGDYTLSPLDILRGCAFRDAVVMARSNMDSHGYTLHPVFQFGFPGRRDALTTPVPYRCLLPSGVENLLAAGLGMSVHRDAWPVVRMQPDLQNQGYAAGTAAAMAVKERVTVRGLDVRKLQRHLVEVGNLPASVLDAADTPPPTREDVAAASQRLDRLQDFADLLATPPETALPLLRQAHAAARTPQHKLNSAHLLAVLGDAAGADTLMEHVRSNPWDEGWTFQGGGNHGSGWSRMGGIIAALGHIGERRALPLIVEKLGTLDARSAFSHYRACAMALEALGDPRAAPALAAALRKPGIAGHVLPSLDDAVTRTPPAGGDTTQREGTLRELMLARALVRCGDADGLGKATLERYAGDVRTLFSWYAQESLRSATPK